MNKKIKIIFLLLSMTYLCHGSVVLQLITQPDFTLYNRIFAKFNTFIHITDGVDISQIYPFEMMMFAMWYNGPLQARILLEIDYVDDQGNVSIIGFALGQLLSPTYMMIRQFVIDPDLFDPTMLGSLLGQCLSFMPQVTQVSVLCPTTFLTTIATLEYIGFQLNESVDFPVPGIYGQWDLNLRGKCAICDVLYGPEFWKQPDALDDDAPFCDDDHEEEQKK